MTKRLTTRVTKRLTKAVTKAVTKRETKVLTMRETKAVAKRVAKAVKDAKRNIVVSSPLAEFVEVSVQQNLVNLVATLGGISSAAIFGSAKSFA